MSGAGVVEMIEAALSVQWDPLFIPPRRTRADGEYHGRWVVVYVTIGGVIVEGKRFSSKSAANKAARSYTRRNRGSMRAYVKRFRTGQWRARPAWRATGGWMSSIVWWMRKAGQP